jgi:hypothetical protein
MSILSFDVGQKNLAYCVVNCDGKGDEQIIKINGWNIVDISFENNSDENLNNFLQNYKKMKIDDLRNNMVKYGLPILNLKKNQLLNTTEAHFVNKGLIKKKLTILDISTILVKKLDDLNILNGIDTVLIENQPCMKNPTMKSIQMVLYTYFIVRGFIDKKDISNNITYQLKNLKFISAKNKLKKCEEIDELKERTKNYKDRKKLAIEYCSHLLNEHKEKDNIAFFNSHGKKDDLADCYLQAIYFIDDVNEKDKKEGNKIKRKQKAEEKRREKEKQKQKKLENKKAK